MNLEKLIPENYGQLENSDLPLSEGRIKRLIREDMTEEQTLDGDVPHVVNCVLSEMLKDIIDELMDEAEMMAKVKEAHLRTALRKVEVEAEYSEEREKFIDHLEKISSEIDQTAQQMRDQNK